MAARARRRLEVAGAFLQLGLTSFGGPAAHVVYFRTAFVVRRRWLDDGAFAELLALVQLLPGPSSTQLAVILGIGRAGLAGGVLAWLGFVLPSAALMVAFALAVTRLGDLAAGPWLHGLKVVVAGVVAQAVVAMGRRLCPDGARRVIALLAGVAALALPGTSGQLAAIGIGGALGWLRRTSSEDVGPHGLAYGGWSTRTAALCLALFVTLLAALPALRALQVGPALAVIDSFYRAGALVFGGGHVILPLLQAEVVAPGWISPELFLAGYGAAQALPGPLFTFAAYLGATMTTPWPPLLAAVVCLLALFLPSALLLIGVLPFWARLRRLGGMAGTLGGVGAAVVGLLAAVLIDPIWPAAIGGPSDLAIALVAFGLLAWGRLPPWLIVIGCTTASALWSGAVA